MQDANGCRVSSDKMTMCPGAAHIASMLILRVAGTAFSFSFSSAELALAASRSRLEAGVGSRDDTDSRRMCVGVTAGLPNALGGPAMDTRADDVDGIRVGLVSFAIVLDVELLREMVGGGPIEPSIDRFRVVDVVVVAAVPPSIDRLRTVEVVAMVPFARTLRVRAAFTVEGVSISLPFCAAGVLVALLVSDKTDDGLEPITLGVPKMDDSRRWGGTFDDEAGVALAAPRTLMRRLSCNEPSEWTISIFQRRTYQFELLLFRVQRDVQALEVLLVLRPLLLEVHNPDLLVRALLLQRMHLLPELVHLLLERIRTVAKRAQLDARLALLPEERLEVRARFDLACNDLLQRAALLVHDPRMLALLADGALLRGVLGVLRVAHSLAHLVRLCIAHLDLRLEACRAVCGVLLLLREGRDLGVALLECACELVGVLVTGADLVLEFPAFPLEIFLGHEELLQLVLDLGLAVLALRPLHLHRGDTLVESVDLSLERIAFVGERVDLLARLLGMPPLCFEFVFERAELRVALEGILAGIGKLRLEGDLLTPQ